MERLTISCASCGQAWAAAVPFSVYEQQAVESCPCPHCGAYTLCCQEAGGARVPGPRGRPRRGLKRIAARSPRER